jgi:hypothetical protein
VVDGVDRPSTGPGDKVQPQLDPGLVHKTSTDGSAADQTKDLLFRPGLSGADGSAGSGGAGGKTDPGFADKDGWMDRNQSWLAPLLSGLGGMASSNSRYLGSALLQGAGAAANSYEDVQNQQAKRDRINTETAAGLAEIPALAYHPKTGTVSGYWDGQPVEIPIAEARGYLQTHNSRFSLVPRQGGATGAATMPLPAPTTSGTSSIMRDAVHGELANMGYDRDSLTGYQPAAVQQIQDAGNAARNLDPLRKELALALKESQSGGTASTWQLNLAQKLNDLGRTWAHVDLGLREQDIGAANLVDKIHAQLAGRSQDAAGQRAVAALENYAAQLPKMEASPEGQARTVASMMSQAQRDKDLQDYQTAYRNEAGVQGATYDQQNAIGQRLIPAFEQEHSSQYIREQQQLSDLYMGKNDPGVNLPNGGHMGTFEWLTKNGQLLNEPGNEPLLRQAQARFGNLLRYFNVQQGQR